MPRKVAHTENGELMNIVRVTSVAVLLVAFTSLAVAAPPLKAVPVTVYKKPLTRTNSAPERFEQRRQRVIASRRASLAFGPETEADFIAFNFQMAFIDWQEIREILRSARIHEVTDERCSELKRKKELLEKEMFEASKELEQPRTKKRILRQL